ncbi:ankyrin repeat domain-containing protein [Enterobacter sp. Bisph1]|uniref:ankyrin repeat domain-containing protein n=1 Tax=Enterobacter sp. Bisph1 TaxID=1274399 RepID=UPI000907CEC2|nr:ankyrin repeat domain-containing protein [Enterobacter sp. Bisph1]
MKKIIFTIVFSFLFVLLSACNDMKKIDPEKHFSGPQLVLAKAIQTADRESVLHLSKKTDLNSPGKEQLTLLFFALNEAMYNNNPTNRLDIITELVRAGADPQQAQPNMPGTPAQMMAMGDKDIWLKAMLDGGLDPNSRDKLLNVPLIYSALSSKNTDTLALLIERGADVNTRDTLGNTPLVDAFFKADLDKVNFLLEHGANPNLVNKQGRDFKQIVDKHLLQIKQDTDYYKNVLKLKEKVNNLPK